MCSWCDPDVVIPVDKKAWVSLASNLYPTNPKWLNHKDFQTP